MRINREGSILRRSWISSPTAGPADVTSGDPNRVIASLEADGCQGGFSYGQLAESPERDGIRFHAPKWISDIDLFGKYSQRLLKDRTKRFPSLAKFQKSKTEVDTQILWSYFVDHAGYEDIYATFSRKKVAAETYGVCDIGTGDAKSLEEAVELAAKRNGTFSVYDQDTNSFTYLDQTAAPGPKLLKTIKARKINAEIYRVKFNLDDDNQYYLSEKLDPSKRGSIRPMQLYIEDLVNEGYALMKMARPTDDDRRAARAVRKAAEKAQVARAQLGKGTNPKIFDSWDNGDEELFAVKRGRSQAATEHMEHKRLAAQEARFRRQLAQPVSEETVFADLVVRTGVDAAKAKFIQTHPWQPPAELLADLGSVIEFKPGPAISHDVLRMSIAVLLASIDPALQPGGLCVAA